MLVQNPTDFTHNLTVYLYCKVPQYALQHWWGEGIFLEYSISFEQYPQISCNATSDVDNHDDCRGFLEEWQLHRRCILWEISDTRVDTKLEGIEVTCNVSCRMTLHMVLLSAR